MTRGGFVVDRLGQKICDIFNSLGAYVASMDEGSF